MAGCSLSAQYVQSGAYAWQLIILILRLSLTLTCSHMPHRHTDTGHRLSLWNVLCAPAGLRCTLCRRGVGVGCGDGCGLRMMPSHRPVGVPDGHAHRRGHTRADDADNYQL
jgi:hypothetical protein